MNPERDTPAEGRLRVEPTPLVAVEDTGGGYRVVCPYCGGVHRHGRASLGLRQADCPGGGCYELVRLVLPAEDGGDR